MPVTVGCGVRNSGHTWKWTVFAEAHQFWAPHRVEYLVCTSNPDGRWGQLDGRSSSRPSARPPAHLAHIDCQHRTVGRLYTVLWVLLTQQREGKLSLLALVEDPGAPAEAYPPEAAPVFLVVVDEDRDLGTDARVLDPAQLRRALRLAVYG